MVLSAYTPAQCSLENTTGSLDASAVIMPWLLRHCKLVGMARDGLAIINKLQHTGLWDSGGGKCGDCVWQLEEALAVEGGYLLEYARGWCVQCTTS